MVLQGATVVSEVIMVHSIVNNKAPEYLTFISRCGLTSYKLTENEYIVTVPQPRSG